MPKQLSTGDKIQYARKDCGCRTSWRDPRNRSKKSSWDFLGTRSEVPGAIPVKPETILAGYDIPLDHCQALFDEGVVELVPIPAEEVPVPPAVDPADNPAPVVKSVRQPSK